MASPDEITADFRQRGWAPVPALLSREEATKLRDLVDGVFADPGSRATGNVKHDFSAARLFELHPAFIELAEHPVAVTLARAVLGEDCHIIAQNVLRSAPGQVPFTHAFHIDDPLLFPLPSGVDRHDPRIDMPVYWLVIHVALSSIDTPAKGPTAYVPGSHYSGRRPDPSAQPVFEGATPEYALASPGDAYLHNSQCWHAAHPNTSTATRYLLQNVYGARFVGHWFHPYVNYRLPAAVTDDPDRDRQLWGLYESGRYS